MIIVAPQVEVKYFQLFFKCGVIDVLVLVDEQFWTLNYFNGSLYQVDEFDNKLRDLHGYRLDVLGAIMGPWIMYVGNDEAGPGMYFLEQLLKQLNATVNLRIVGEDITKSVAEQTAYRVSVVDYDFMLLFEFNITEADSPNCIWLYEASGMCIMLQRSGKKTFIEVLLTPLSIVTCCFIFFILVLYAVVFAILIRNDRFRHVFRLCRTLLGQPMATRTSERGLLESFDVFAFIIASAYLSILTSQLSLPKFEPPIETLEQLNQSKEMVYATQTVISVFTEHYDPVLLSHFMPLNLVKYALGQETNYNIVGRCLSQSIFREGITRRIGVPRDEFYIMKEKLFMSPTAVVVSPRKPILQSVRWLLQQTQESGLMDKWKEMTTYQFYKMLPPRSELQHTKPTVDMLRFDDLKDFFLVFLAGSVIACLVFVIEVFVGYILRFLKSKKVIQL